jgi:hypothetical protein
MARILVPSSGPGSWKALLAEPSRQWATGFSACTLAHCWEAASGLPPEVAALLRPTFGELELLLALPEHKVPLPGGGADSQSDVFVLVRGEGGLIACTIEGKVDEPFGPTIGEWSLSASPGKRERLTFLCKQLGLAEPPPPDIRYQLLHRTVSAIIEAERFDASAATMVVHSFSPTKRWFEDFSAFARLVGGEPRPETLMRSTAPTSRPLYIGWAAGDPAFLTS